MYIYTYTALNMAVKVPAQERVDSLFNMAMYLSTKYENENSDDNSPVKSPIGMYQYIYEYTYIYIPI
jgi:hypothetical protein